MALPSFLLRFFFTKPRPSSFPFIFSSSFSSLQDDAVSIISPPNLDKPHILHQISLLFPTIPTPKSQTTKPLVDGFLSPEDKLRGVFLLKLKGKYVIQQALSNVDVEINADLLGKVVNSGNMSGESMVMFFNWALTQPLVPKNISTYCVIVKALGRRKFFKFMMEVLNNMRVERVEGDLLILSIVIDSYVRAGHVSKAIHVFMNLDDYFLGMNRDTEALNVLLLCLCRRNHVGAANSVLWSMKGKVVFDVATYNSVAGGWCRFG